MHALIHRSTQDTRQLCSVWEPGQRIYQAFPSRCQSRQPSFHSLTFQFYPPALSPWNSPLPLLPNSLSLLSRPQSLLLALLFSACLEEQSQSCQSLHFVTTLRMGLSLTPRHVRWEIFYVHQIRSACRPVAGRSSTLQHGGPNLYHCLFAAPSLHLFLSVFHAPSFFPPFTSCPPLFVIVSLTSAPFISLLLARCLSLTLSLSSLFVHSLFVLALCFVYAKLS